MPNNFDNGVYGSGRVLGERQSKGFDVEMEYDEDYEGDWDGASEMDEDEFMKQLEDEEELEDIKSLEVRPTKTGEIQPDIVERTAPPELIQSVFGTCELFEIILLQLPAYQVTTSCRLVRREWNYIIETSSVLRDYWGDPFVATLKWPPNASKDVVQYKPFQPVRKKYLGGPDFTELDWSRSRGNLRGSCLILQSMHNKMNQSSPSLSTLESTTKGRLIQCRVCAHLHERFYTHMLHPAVSEFGHLSKWHVCFTGYGNHIVMQLKTDREENMDQMLAYFGELLEPPEQWRSVPVAETLVNRFSISIRGSLFGFSTISGNHKACITVDSVLSMAATLFIENCHELVDHWAGQVRSSRWSWKQFSTQPVPVGMTRNAWKAEKARRKRLLVADKTVLNTYKEWREAWKEFLER